MNNMKAILLPLSLILLSGAANAFNEEPVSGEDKKQFGEEINEYSVSNLPELLDKKHKKSEENKPLDYNGLNGNFRQNNVPMNRPNNLYNDDARITHKEVTEKSHKLWRERIARQGADINSGGRAGLPINPLDPKNLIDNFLPTIKTKIDL